MQSVKNLCHFICPRYFFLEQIGEETGGGTVDCIPSYFQYLLKREMVMLDSENISPFILRGNLGISKNKGTSL